MIEFIEQIDERIKKLQEEPTDVNIGKVAELNLVKIRLQQLILSGVMQPLPSKEEMTLELKTMLKELNKDVKPSYLKRSVLKGVEIGFKKCYQYVTGNCA
tara:strand:- start:506 stop:805 length:300 start_codon:yes stop_codon:yes gene_type:complete